MKILQIISAYSILSLNTLFLFSNTKQLNMGSGYLYLALLSLPLIILLITSWQYIMFSKAKTSVAYLLLFLIYFTINYLLDTMSLQEVRAVTVGTTGGIVFALALGFISSFSLSIIYKLRQFKQNHTLSFIIGICYILFTIWLSNNTLEYHLAEIRSDIFLIDNQEGYYQRVGNFFFIQFMTIGALISVLMITATKPKFFTHFSLLTLYSFSAFLFAVISQLVGSNSGFASVVAFLLVFYVYFLVSLNSENKFNLLDIKVRSLFFGKLAWGIFQSISIILGIASIFFFSKSMNIDLDRFRITSYGSGSVSSFDSRIKLFKDNFIEHLSYNPIFGHTQVDVITTGAGTYTHSLISLATHLGIIGLFIFIVFMYKIFKEISTSSNEKNSLYLNKRYGLFRLFALSSVLLLSIISAFYIWIPLWFAIGLFGISIIERSNISQRHFNNQFKK